MKWKMEETSTKVNSMFIYPIKSCKGISVSQAPLTPFGTYSSFKISSWSCLYVVLTHLQPKCFICFMYEWWYIKMIPFVLDGLEHELWISDDLLGMFEYAGFRWDRNWMIVNEKGRAYSQRNEPKLALIHVEMPIEAFLEDWEPTQTSYMGKVPLIKYLICFCYLYYLHPWSSWVSWTRVNYNLHFWIHFYTVTFI